MNQAKLKDFLTYLSSDTEPGLVVCEDKEMIENVSLAFENQGFKRVSNWQELAENIKNSINSYMILGDEIEKDIYDALAQFRTGGIEIMDKETLEKDIVSFNPKDVSFAILSEESSLRKIEETMPIKDKVGITEIIS